jgi:hypothetical protein
MKSLTSQHKTANAFAGTFAFFPTHGPTQKKQKSLQANAQGQCKLDTLVLRLKRATTHNKGFAIAGVPCFADNIWQGGSSVLRMKFSANNPRPNAKPQNVIGQAK